MKPWLWLQPTAVRQVRRAGLPSAGIVREEGEARGEGKMNMAGVECFAKYCSESTRRVRGWCAASI